MVAPTSEAAFINWHIGATMASPSGTPKRPPFALCLENGTKSRCMSMIISASFLFMGAVAFVILSRVPAPVRDSHSENISDPPPLNLNEAAEEVKIGGGRNDSRAMSSRRVTFSEQENPMTQQAEVLAPQFARLTNSSSAILVSMIPGGLQQTRKKTRKRKEEIFFPFSLPFKNKIVATKKLGFSFFPFLVSVVNLVQVFKVRWNNNFLFWHYWLFCTKNESPTPIWSWDDNFVFP